MTSNLPSLAHAWQALHFTALRTAGVTAVPITPAVLQLMMHEVLRAWEIADAVEQAGSEPSEDVDGVRTASIWHLTCVVKRAILAEADKAPSHETMGELQALWHWATTVEAHWNVEAAELFARVQKGPAYAAEAAGVLLASPGELRFAAGGDA